MEKKILFMDLDGTLLTDSKDITTENMEAIHKAIAAGHAVVVTTGRPLASTVLLLERLGLTKPGCYAITANGSVIYDAHKKENIFECGVNKDIVREAFDVAYQFHIHPQTYSATKVLVEHDNKEIQYYSNSIKMDYEVVERIEDALECDPIKMLFIDLEDRSKLEAFRKYMEPYTEKNHLEVFFSCEQYLEMTPHGINKGSAVRYMSDFLQVPMENTIGAGDAENDITMLKAVHTSCVMKNARPEMHQYGSYITKRDNNHSGIAEIIEKFML